MTTGHTPDYAAVSFEIFSPAGASDTLHKLHKIAFFHPNAVLLHCRLQPIASLIMAALCNRGGGIIFLPCSDDWQVATGLSESSRN